jgi:hypothetical protein
LPGNNPEWLADIPARLADIAGFGDDAGNRPINIKAASGRTIRDAFRENLVVRAVAGIARHFSSR